MKQLAALFGLLLLLAGAAVYFTAGRSAPATNGMNTASTLGNAANAPPRETEGPTPGSSATPEYLAEQQRALTQLRREDGWQTTPSGLRWRKVGGTGNGRHPTAQDQVSFRYVGRFTSGEVFDRSQEPVTMPLANLIPGWQEGLLLMSPGERFEFAIPATLGYGEGQGPIPAGATLMFQVELVAINPPAGAGSPPGR